MEKHLTTGEQLRATREHKGWTQKKLSEKTGLTQNRISALETGKRPISATEWSLFNKHFGTTAPLPNRRSLPYPNPSWRVRPPDAFIEGTVGLNTLVYRARKSFGNLAALCLRKIQAREDAAFSFKFLNDAANDSGH